MPRFLNTSPDKTLFRSIVYPTETKRLDRGNTFIIPTYDRDVIVKIVDKIKTSNLKFRMPRSYYIPLMKTSRYGNRKIIHRNKKVKDELKVMRSRGFINAVSTPATLLNYNGVLDYTDFFKEAESKKAILTIATTMTPWYALLETIKEDTNHYVVFTPDNIHANILSPSKVRMTDWKIKHWYASFLYHMKFKYTEFLNLFRERRINVIFTDYKYTVAMLFDDPVYDGYKTGSDALMELFRILRKMKFGVPITDESTEDLTILDEKHEEVILKQEQNEQLVDDINESVNKEIKSSKHNISSDLIKALEKLNESNNMENLSEEAEKILNIISKGKIKEQVTSPRMKQLMIKQESVLSKKIKKDMADLSMEILNMSDDTIEKKEVPLDNKFNSFRLVDMENSYSKSLKDKDRKGIMSKLSEVKSNPIVLTAYNESRPTESHDSSYKNVHMTFSSPDDEEVKHSFTIKMPIIKDNKFLYIGGSDKIMTRQKVALPIIRLNDSVVITTYYSKIIITLSSGNFSRDVYKIGKFIRKIRKEFLADDLHNFKFIPTHNKGLSNNYYYEELVNISRVVSEIFINKDNYLNLSAKSKSVGKLNGIEYFSSESEEILVDSNNKDEKTILEFINDLILQISNEDIKQIWLDSIKGYGTNNIVYSNSMDYPLFNMVLHAVDYDLKEILDRMKDEYGLDYVLLTDGKKRKPSSDTDYIQFKGFTLGIKYGSSANRIMLSKLLTYDFTSLDNLNIEKILQKDMNARDIMKLDNLVDLLIDPITKDVMNDLGIPNDFVGAILYANAMLVNYERPISEVSLKYERMPSNSELIEGMMYKAISKSWADYNNKLKQGLNPRRIKFTVAPDAVINLIQDSPSIIESSKLNPVQHVASLSTISSKGLKGLGVNNDRAYKMAKREWDKSFMGVISDVSPYNAKSGVNKVLSLNPNITSSRGYFGIKNEDEEVEMSEKMSVTEGLGPFTQKHDSSPRTAMGLQQFQHLMPTLDGDISPVTYGMDESLRYLDSDFVIKAKDDGVIVDINKDYVKIKYDDEELGEEIFNLNQVVRNSAKAFYTSNEMKVLANIKKGTKLVKDDIVAFNKDLYKEDDNGLPVFTSGPIVYVALSHVDSSHEDAVVISESLAKRLKSKVVKRVTVKLGPKDHIFNYAKIDPSKEIDAGDILMKYIQSDGSPLEDLFGDSNLSDSLANVSKSHYQGVIRDIYIHSKAKRSLVSNSINKFMNYVESYYDMRGSKRFRSKYEEENINTVDHVVQYPVSKKVKVGRSTLYPDEILVEYYIEVEQNFSITDKITFGNTALKGVCGFIRKDEMRPYGAKTGRKIDATLSPISPMARKVYSFFMNGMLIECMNKANEDLLKIVEEG